MEKKRKNRIRIKTFAVSFFIVAFFAAVYILLEFRSNGFAVLAGGLIVLIAGYLMITASEQEKNEQMDVLTEKLEEMIRVQKAVYTAIKKNNEAICEGLESMGNSSQSEEYYKKLCALQEKNISENIHLAETQVTALKAVAKHNKENARQITLKLDENTERLLACLQSSNAGDTQKVLESLQNGNAGMEQRIGSKIESAIYDVEQRYQEMSNTMLANTMTMTERIEELGEKLEGTEGILGSMPEMADEIFEPEIVPESVEDFTVDGINPQDIVEEPESVAESELMVEPEPVEEIEPVPEPEPVKPEMPVIDDPNRAMTPDEIAAMIAAMTADTGASEPIAEPEPEPEPIAEPEPVIEEPEPAKPEMPVIDDPNRAMTPDEIAAMIAALTQ